jgi:hypothetical protein
MPFAIVKPAVASIPPAMHPASIATAGSDFFFDIAAAHLRHYLRADYSIRAPSFRRKHRDRLQRMPQTDARTARSVVKRSTASVDTQRMARSPNAVR